jgi:hypothetical protein
MPMIFIALLAACTNRQERIPSEGGGLLPCHIIYDAGSHGTRLYIYQQTSSGWIKNSGPKIGALADPVRGIRGKTIADTGAVVDEIVESLEDMRHDGPSDDTGIPLWPAFDWRERCKIETVSVYATAGMRLAEQQDSAGSKKLWEMLMSRHEH